MELSFKHEGELKLSQTKIEKLLKPVDHFAKNAKRSSSERKKNGTDQKLRSTKRKEEYQRRKKNESKIKFSLF